MSNTGAMHITRQNKAFLEKTFAHRTQDCGKGPISSSKSSSSSVSAQLLTAAFAWPEKSCCWSSKGPALAPLDPFFWRPSSRRRNKQQWCIWNCGCTRIILSENLSRLLSHKRVTLSRHLLSSNREANLSGFGAAFFFFSPGSLEVLELFFFFFVSRAENMLLVARLMILEAITTNRSPIASICCCNADCQPGLAAAKAYMCQDIVTKRILLGTRITLSTLKSAYATA